MNVERTQISEVNLMKLQQGMLSSRTNTFYMQIKRMNFTSLLAKNGHLIRQPQSASSLKRTELENCPWLQFPNEPRIQSQIERVLEIHQSLVCHSQGPPSRETTNRETHRID